MKTGILISTISAVILLVGCGEGSVVSSTNEKSVIPKSYSYKAINNSGVATETKLDNYTIKILSNTKQEANPKARHKGVVVKINGKASETMSIEESYINKKIIVTVEDETGKTVKVSDEITVTDDVPVIIIDLTI